MPLSVVLNSGGKKKKKNKRNNICKIVATLVAPLAHALRSDQNSRIDFISTELKSVQKSLGDSDKLTKELNLKLTKSEGKINQLGEDIAKKERDFVAKEKELNSLYETKLGEANDEIREKEEILNTQSEKLSNLQNDLLKARESGEAKDMEIYDKTFEITKLNESLKVAQCDISLKLSELEEKNKELLNIKETLKGANSDIEEKDKRIEVNKLSYQCYFIPNPKAYFSSKSLFCSLIYSTVFVSPHESPLC